MSVTHSKVSGQPNTDPEKVGGEDWDAAHVVELAAEDIPTHSHAGEDITSGTVADGRVAATLARDSEVTTAISDHAAAADPHTGYLKESDFDDVDFLVGTATGHTAAEIVVGTTPGGELGGTWASPTVDTTHSGSSHAGVVSTHEAASDPHTGYVLESLLDAKGDLIAASADNTPAKVTVGANNTLLQADSAQTPGVKWTALGYGITSGLAVSLTTASAYATATTSISAATYADITGASISLAAGTWLVIGVCTGSIVNAHALMHVAITDGANAVVSELSGHIAASGSANVASNGSVTVVAIVAPSGTTTYKLRGARGNTTLTGTWVAMDGAGVGVTNNLTDNSDKGTGIFAIRVI